MFILGPSVFHNPPPPSKVQQKLKFHCGTPPLNLKLLGGNIFGQLWPDLVCFWFAFGLLLVFLWFAIGLLFAFGLP